MVEQEDMHQSLSNRFYEIQQKRKNECFFLKAHIHQKVFALFFVQIKGDGEKRYKNDRNQSQKDQCHTVSEMDGIS